MKKPVTPFMEGESAFKSGVQVIKNPYTFHSDNWLGWDSGWKIAQRKARKAADAAQLEEINNRPLDAWMQEVGQ